MCFVTPLLKMLRVLAKSKYLGQRRQPGCSPPTWTTWPRQSRAPCDRRTQLRPTTWPGRQLHLRGTPGDDCGRRGQEALLIRFPVALWRAVGYASKILPDVPITTSQIELMQMDDIASPSAPNTRPRSLAASDRGDTSADFEAGCNGRCQCQPTARRCQIERSSVRCPRKDPPAVRRDGSDSLAVASQRSDRRRMRHANGEMLSYGTAACDCLLCHRDLR